MNGKTLTRLALSNILRKKHDVKREESMDIIAAVFDEITHALKKDKEVKIPLFGVFFSRQKKERIGRNPRTLEEAVISSRRVTGFRPSRIMKASVASGCKKS
jgi:integration host factor subunit alpha